MLSRINTSSQGGKGGRGYITNLGMNHLSSLSLSSLGDGGMAVTQVGDTNATREVEHLAAARHGHVAPTATLNDLGGQSPNSFGHMPSAEFCEFGETHVCGGAAATMWLLGLDERQDLEKSSLGDGFRSC